MMRKLRRLHPDRVKLAKRTARTWRHILKTGHRPQPFPRRPRLSLLEV